MRFDEDVLQVGDLDLVFSLVLECGGSIIYSSDSKIGFGFSLLAGFGVFLEFFFIFLLFLLDGFENLLFDISCLGMSFDFRFNLIEFNIKFIRFLGITKSLLFLL